MIAVAVVTVLVLAGGIGWLRMPVAVPLRGAVAGELYLPRWSLGPVPGAVLLHGSEGYGAGATRRFAYELAQQGVAALALCYFGCPGRPSTLHDIEIDQVFRAIADMDAYPGVKHGDVTLIGFSRGGELALLAGSQDPEPRAVVAYYGSPQVVASYPSGAPDAWLMNGVPFPTGMEIPVSGIRGPVLLFAGARDRIWPSSFSLDVASELAAHHHPYGIRIYRDAGHGFGGNGSYDYAYAVGRGGGTAQGDQAAARASWAQTVAFIKSLTPAYVAGPLPAQPVQAPSTPGQGAATAAEVAALALLVTCWATGVDADPRRRPHPWLMRRLEPAWTDWEALTWEQKTVITRRRQAVAWVFAILTAAAIFTPLVASAARR